MSHNPEPGRPQPYQRLTADQHEAMASWPHTPSPELFNRAARAHHLVYNENPETPEIPPAKPVHLRDFRLAEIMDDIKHADHFRIQAVQEFRDLRRLNPRTPGRAHIITIALSGSSPLTIGVGTISRPSGWPPQHPPHPQPNYTEHDAAVGFSQLVRDPRWIGMDPIFPLFQDKQALIIGDPNSGAPSAAVGFLPEMMNDEDRRTITSQIPRNPEAQALHTVLTWHGATVHWLPLDS